MSEAENRKGSHISPKKKLMTGGGGIRHFFSTQPQHILGLIFQTQSRGTHPTSQSCMTSKKKRKKRRPQQRLSRTEISSRAGGGGGGTPKFVSRLNIHFLLNFPA